jgi:hypothetical protein
VPLKATNPVFRAKTERFREALRLLHASTTGSAQRMVKAVAKASGLTLSTRSRRWARRARMGSYRHGTRASRS